MTAIATNPTMIEIDPSTIQPLIHPIREDWKIFGTGFGEGAEFAPEAWEGTTSYEPTGTDIVSEVTAWAKENPVLAVVAGFFLLRALK